MHLRMASKIKVNLIITVVTVGFGALTAFVAMQMTEQTILNMASKHTEAIIAQQKVILERVLDDSASFVSHLGSQQMVIDYFQQTNPQEQSPELLKYLDGLDTENRYQAIYVMDKTGETLTSTDPSFVGQNYAFRTYVKGALAGKPTVDAAIGVTSGKFGYYFSYPVKTASGEIIGVAVAKLKDTLIADALQPKDLGADGSAMLVDKYGVVIQSSHPELLFKSLGTLTPEARQTIAETRRFNGFDITSLQYDRTAKEITEQGEPRISVLYDQFNGRDELVGITRIADAPFFIVITEARNFFADAAGGTSIKIGLLILFASVATTLALLLLVPMVVQTQAREEAGKTNERTAP